MTGDEHRYNLFRWARYRASKSGIEFSITKDHIVIPMYCPILDIKLEVGEKTSGPFSPTLDRIDNNKGYTPDNVWVISNIANMMKSKATPLELLKFSEWVQKMFGESSKTS